MRKRFNQLKTLRNYLAYQIFVSFFGTIAIVLGIALLLPNFDTRSFNSIEDDQRFFFTNESLYTQQEYNLDEVFQRNLSVTTLNGFEVILLEKQTGLVSGISGNQLKALQAFIFKADNPYAPLQRRFDAIEIYGPFLVESSTNHYLQYFIKKVDPQREFINSMFDSPWLMLLILLLVSTPLLLWLSWRIAKPVKALRLTANAVATGNLTINPDLETRGINELREVGKSFNRMITSLEKLTSYQQGLLSNISHELKTPLTRMQLAVSLLRRRNGESNELIRIENEIQKLDTMIHDLLILSRQQVNQHLEREIFSINKIWEDVLEDAKFELEQNNIHFYIQQRISYPERHFINGNVGLLASAVENVIRNAQKYAYQCVKVMMYIDKSELLILIDDDGIGVPEDQYEEIFRPFYRVEADRARQTGGTGLGLAIVLNAVKQHKGTAIAEKSPLGGLRIKLQLPLWVE
ncbi:two-component system sensor histidine kinase CpxA [Nicoletella semolina]|uniref:histidine kinase n=1 Tax=Nicoletella semolina TaxID=271160 RepID=A0A4R2N8A4_9PAST|nr:envelope stress sensor histidine kinase CpxA [Nicoletella semolina]MDH2923893.1 two-component system sensor histidine kinase CpxA [Nicoletella semolina]TCP17207.1 two-component system sensor histidine kinase CpxA [Nicoletella semolina]